MKKVIIIIIRTYQRYIARYLGDRCRFYPSCSQYAIDAISAHGVCKGLIMSSWRIIRCSPFSSGGYDPATTDKA